MKELLTHTSHGGRKLKQLQRSDTVAIYELIGSQGLRYGFEVIRIKVRKEQIVFGTQQPVREAYPSDSDFGRLAWSYGRNHWKEAFERYDVLVQAEQENLHGQAPSAFQRALEKEVATCS
jgi:hypothetical protein